MVPGRKNQNNCPDVVKDNCSMLYSWVKDKLNLSHFIVAKRLFDILFYSGQVLAWYAEILYH